MGEHLGGNGVTNAYAHCSTCGHATHHSVSFHDEKVRGKWKPVTVIDSASCVYCGTRNFDAWPDQTEPV